MKNKNHYICNQCGAISSQWVGQCVQCSAWNSLTEEKVIALNKNSQIGGYAPKHSTVTMVEEVVLDCEQRMNCGLNELNRVLGGGMVEGSVVLIGGDPGIGKSTLLIQTLAFLSAQHNILYVTGEESLQQVAMRAKRLQLPSAGLKLLAETEVESIINHAKKEKPKVMVIDSIQTIFTNTLQAAAGG